MSHPAESTLLSFANRTLPADASAVVERHVAECDTCRAALTDLARAATISASDVTGGSAAGLTAGAQVGRYSLVKLLGEGGMGAVYLAHDTQLDRRVALKLLHAATSPEARARMAREARVMAKLVHPNIVTVYDAGEAEGQMYIVMELVEGQTLASWLESAAHPFEAVLTAFRTAGLALAEAHAVGIVHRDFKPENVLLDRNGRVAVTDFGIASDGSASMAPPANPSAPSLGQLPIAPAVTPAGTPMGIALGDSSGGGRSLTRTGTLMGTPAYMSPEQFLGQPAGPASDQFSFGVALFEALYHQAPFAGTTLGELRRAVLRGELVPLADAVRAMVPPSVHRALVRAMSREVTSRFPDMKTFLAALEPPTPKVSRRAYGLAALGLLLVAGGGGAFAWKRHVDEVHEHKLAAAFPHEACAKLVSDGLLRSCFDFPVNGSPPHVFALVDNSLSMVGHKEEETTLLLTVADHVAPRANFGAWMFPGKGGSVCKPGNELISPAAVAYYPLLARDHRLHLAQSLEAAPLGLTSAAATLRDLEVSLTKRHFPGKQGILLVTDGGVVCGGVSSCDASACTRNIESQVVNGQMCTPGGPSCCTGGGDAGEYCLDDQGTRAAIEHLASEGVRTWVVGVNAIERYKPVLDSFATAGGTRRPGAQSWYDDRPDTLSELEHDLRQALVVAPLTCDFALPNELLHPDSAKVTFDGSVIAPGTYQATSRKLVLTGSSCDRARTGGVTHIRIYSE